MKNEGGLDEELGRFVLLHHRYPPQAAAPDHWDLMFDTQDALLTLQIVTLPSSGGAGAQRLPATRLADHRRRYLTYEGEISGNRGRVRQWAAGEFQCASRVPEPQSPAHLQMTAHATSDEASVRLVSDTLQAQLLIPRCRVGQKTWLTVNAWNLQPPSELGSGEAELKR